jgi:Family of unknown function (DUF6121)
MSGQPSPPRDARLAPILVTVVYAALVAAGWGFTSLVLDQEVIVEPNAGPFVGPVMVLGASVVEWRALWGLRNRRSVGRTALAATASVYALMLAVGAAAFSLATGKLPSFLLFLGHYATSPFVVGPTILAGLVVLVFWLAGARPMPREPFDRFEPSD